jgi:CheY-like chemotaxis protein
VTETNDPIKALQLLRFTYSQFDLVFTDFYMPKMNGLHFLQHVKASYPHIPVVITSAQPNPDMQMQALSKGASSCMFETHKEEDFRKVLVQLFPKHGSPRV